MKWKLKYCVFLYSCQLLCQTGAIEGKVIFKLDSSILPGATVVISGTNIGGQTDINGVFGLSELEAGNYDLVVEYLGYGKDTIPNIIVKDNETTEISLGLPAGECFEKTELRKCPIDGKSKNVIPIIYGLPDQKNNAEDEKRKIKTWGL